MRDTRPIQECAPSLAITRRILVRAASLAGAGFVSGVAMPRDADAASEEVDEATLKILTDIAGEPPRLSDRVVLRMPPSFSNGGGVPVTLSIDSAMTAADHVRQASLIAPNNPIVLAARFHFSVASGHATVSTRMRLAKPQYVFATAEMSDGAVLMTRTWVKVETDGCK